METKSGGNCRLFPAFNRLASSFAPRGLALVLAVLASSPNIANAQSQRDTPDWEKAEIEFFTFAVGRVLNAIKREYIEPTDENALIKACLDSMPSKRSPARREIVNALLETEPEKRQDAIDRCLTGIVGQLDERSKLDKYDFSIPLGSIGFELASTEKGATVVDTFVGSPAQKAGIRRGDVIVSIEGQDVANKTLAEVIALSRGRITSHMVLGVQRNSETLRFRLVREVVFPGVPAAKLLPPDIGYIFLQSFDEKMFGRLYDALAAVRTKSPTGLRGLILDLRQSTGGRVDFCIAFSGLFLKKGDPIAEFRGRNPKGNDAYKAIPDGFGDVRSDKGFIALRKEFRDFSSIPLVVLTGPKTSAGAEIVAASLQDNGRARIVGSHSMGLSGAAARIDFDNLEIIKSYKPTKFLSPNDLLELLSSYSFGPLLVTSGRFYRPNGRPIDKEGVTPDIAVAVAEKDADGLPPSSIGPPADLAGDPAIAKAVELLAR